MNVSAKIFISIFAAVSLCFVPPVLTAFEMIGSFSEIPTGGCRVDFTSSSTVDFVLLPPDSPEVFGPGRRGTAVIVRGAGSVTVGRLDEQLDDVFRIKLNEPSTRWLEIVPILSETTDSVLSSPGRIHISGSDASWRNFENELADLSNAALEFQRKNRCFSCHIMLPLAWTATLAEFRCMGTPRPTLASIAENIVSLQRSDGSFSAPGHPEYGIVSPTLAAAASLACLNKFCSETNVIPALRKATDFLIAHPSGSGLPELDFTFPPLFIGKPFAARLFLDILEALRTADLELAVPHDAQLDEHRDRAVDVLNSRGDVYAGDLWKHFSMSTAAEAPDSSSATDSFFLMRKTVSSFSGERDPEMLALYECVLRDHGQQFEAQTIPAPRPEELKRRIWRLYQQLSREPLTR